MSTLDLLPCPFCGSTVTVITGDTWYLVECEDPTFECNAQGPVRSSSDHAEAAWNRRAPSPPEKVEG